MICSVTKAGKEPMDMSREYDPVDTEIVLKAQAGDQQAFEQLYLQFYKSVYGMCYQYFRNKEKAEDATQDTFLIIQKEIKHLKQPETFFVWMNRIAYTRCCNIYRKEHQDASSYSANIQPAYLENGFDDVKHNDPVSDIQRNMAKEIIIQALEKMSEDYRLTGYLYLFEQLSYKEISLITGSTTGVVGSQISRIKDRLRKELEKKHFTRDTCFSILASPTIFLIYQEYINEIKVPPPKYRNEPKELNTRSYERKSWNQKLPKLALAMTIGVPAVSVIYHETGLFKQAALRNNISYIEEINYDKELTNQPVEVGVKISEGSYDQVLFDGKENLTVFENGVHTLELYENEKQIDSKEFEITNIDTQPPEVIEQETKEDISLTLYDENGIDYDNVHVMINGEVFDDYKLDKESNTIHFLKDIKHNVTLSVSDRVGNKANVAIQFFERNVQ